MQKPVKLTIDVKQREQRGLNNEEKNNNSCTIKKNISGFYTEDEANCRHIIYCLQTRNFAIGCLCVLIDEPSFCDIFTFRSTGNRFVFILLYNPVFSSEFSWHMYVF